MPFKMSQEKKIRTKKKIMKINIKNHNNNNDKSDNQLKRGADEEGERDRE